MKSYFNLFVAVPFLLGLSGVASAAPQVTDSFANGWHTTTVNLKDANSTYIVPAGISPVQNNRLILRNLDSRVSIMPTLNVDGRPDLSSIDGMLRSILHTGMTDEAKVIAIWQFLIKWRYWNDPAESGNEVHDPVKFLNVYGYGLCDDCAQNLCLLSKAAGLQARPWNLNGHAVAEVYFAGAWHMFDADHQVIFRASNGHIMSVSEIMANTSVITKTAYDPVGSSTVDWMLPIYASTSDNAVYPVAPTPTHKINPVLKPGDQAIFDFAVGKLYHGPDQRDHHPDDPPPTSFSNGTLQRQLRLK